MFIGDFTSVCVIIILASVCGDFVQASSCKKRWCKYSVSSCITHTLALTQWNTPNLQQCMLKASSSSAVDDPVTQWNKQTGICSLFYYQQVCPYLQTSPSSWSEQCSVYRLSALVSCDASLLNPRFLGVWLAGGSSRLGNLVCQSDPNNYRMVSVNIAWSDEGAVFNGVSSYALVNDSRMIASDTSAGFTWLMRLKRQPQVQPFMELTTCSLEYGRHFWEYIYANQMYYSKGWSGDAFNFKLYSVQNVLPNDNSTWINIGISVGATANQPTFFVGNNFVSHTVVTSQNSGATTYCFLSIGKRWSDTRHLLKGVVRAVAVANGSMTEVDIRNFFASIP